MATPEPILGIDLGTTHSLVGVVESGFPILLADPEGHRLTPSAVWYQDTGEPVVGRAALARRALDPARVITSAKRLIGRRPGEGEWDPPYPVHRDPHGRSAMPAGLRTVTAEDVSADVLRTLAGIACQRLGFSVTKAVVTVPAYFSETQRAATKRAANAAGLEVVRLLNEPTAAALAAGIDGSKGCRLAVYDLGGGTFDLSLLDIRDGIFRVAATRGDTQLGGDDFDAALAQFAWEKAGRSDPWAAVPVPDRVRLIEAARRAKELLSTEPTARIDLPFLTDGSHIDLVTNRTELESLIAPAIDRTIALCKLAMADAGWEPAQLDRILMVGGSSRIPLVRQRLAQWAGRNPDLAANPDEAVALGAVIQAGMLSGALRHALLLDVTPLSLGLETIGGLMNVIIPRNTTIPCKAGEMFTNAAAGQTSVRVRILQGEREMARDNWELGVIDVPFDPQPRGAARIGVQFSLDADGLLTVLARDVHTGQDHVLEVRDTAVMVDDNRVEAMLESSLAHALDDFHERALTEARLAATEILDALGPALEALGPLDGPEWDAIESARQAVLAAMEGDNPAALKQAVKSLDHATEPLAARLVDQALQQAADPSAS